MVAEMAVMANEIEKLKKENALLKEQLKVAKKSLSLFSRQEDKQNKEQENKGN